MRVTPDDLTQRLAKGPPRAILLFGDEPLLIEESVRRTRAGARQHGFAERIPLSAESGFEWGRLAGSSQTLSLFSERRLIELRLPTGKPGDAGTQALIEYCQAADPDVCLLVITGRLDSRSKQAKWVKALDDGGWVVEHKALGAVQFRGWFRGRLRDKGLAVDGDTTESLCHFLEGNLLAAAQEIDRMALFAGSDGRVDAGVVARGLVDHARFNVYALTDACLAGDTRKALRILAVLKNEGTEPVLVSWAMARELRSLARIEHGLRHGEQKGRLFKQHNIWSNRAPVVTAALGRLGERQLESLTRQMARCDRVLKGRERGLIWHELDVLVLMMCDTTYIPVHSAELYAAS